MGEALVKTGNAVTLDAFAQKTALRLGVTPEAVRAEFKKLGKPAFNRPAPEEPFEPMDEAEAPPEPKPTLLETSLLKLLFAHDELVPWAVEQLAPEWIEHATARAIVEWRFRAATEGTWRGLGALLDAFESDASKQLITECATNEKPIPNPTIQIADVATRLRNLHIDQHRATLRQQMQQPGVAPETLTALLREDHDLRVLKQTPIPPPAG